MSDHLSIESESPSIVATESSCNSTDECDHHESNPQQGIERIDGAGEPCPTPLVWQEIRENYFEQSQAWEFEHGPHRLVGRTWGQGRSLYFLNNFAATAELFSLTMWLLRDDFRCVVFDSVTRGRQVRETRKTPGILLHANDLQAVANHLGDDEIFVYGAGFGAAVALQTALDRPRLISQMMLQHGFANRRLSLFERMLAKACLYSRGNLDHLPQRRRFQAVNHKPWFPPHDDSRFEFLVNSTGNIPLRDLGRRGLAVHAFDVASRLEEIKIPVMLLRTEGEGKLAAQSQELLEPRLKNCRTEWMHSAGQHPYLTHPHRVAKLIRSFCESTPNRDVP